MMRYAIVAGVLALAACTVNMDPEGQPCDKQKHCLPGYVCNRFNQCTRSAGSGSTSGTSGSTGTSASSTTGTSGSTSSTTGSSTTTGSSGTTACGGVVCPAPQFCEAGATGPQCLGRTSGLCSVGTACSGSNEVCVMPARSGTGLCLSTCDLNAPSCPTGSSCVALTGERGNTFSACVPSPGPVACTSSAQCGGKSCLPFDVAAASTQPTALENNLPVMFCDTPLGGGLPTGGNCTVDADCQSGLCMGLSTSSVGRCQQGCASAADCPTGASCLAAPEFGHLRHARICVATPSGCTSCGSCGLDAPTCSSLSKCVFACDPAIQDVDPCGHGRSCVNDGNNNLYCDVNGAVCP